MHIGSKSLAHALCASRPSYAHEGAQFDCTSQCWAMHSLLSCSMGTDQGVDIQVSAIATAIASTAITIVANTPPISSIVQHGRSRSCLRMCCTVHDAPFCPLRKNAAHTNRHSAPIKRISAEVLNNDAWVRLYPYHAADGGIEQMAASSRWRHLPLWDPSYGYGKWPKTPGGLRSIATMDKARLAMEKCGKALGSGDRLWRQAKACRVKVVEDALIISNFCVAISVAVRRGVFKLPQRETSGNYKAQVAFSLKLRDTSIILTAILKGSRAHSQWVCIPVIVLHGPQY